MSKFRSVCLALALGSVATITATSVNASGAESAVAAPVQFKQWLAGISSFAAQFDQRVLDSDGNLIQTGSGTLMMQQPNRLRWQSVEPSEVLLVADGTTTWYHDVFAEQVTILDFAQTVERTPFILLSSQDDALWQQYSVTPVAAGYQIKAKSADSQVPELLVRVEHQQLIGIELTDASGQRSEFSFRQPLVNGKIAPEQFQFTVPADVQVDDQRTAVAAPVCEPTQVQ